MSMCRQKKSIQNKINRLHTGILLFDKNYNKSGADVLRHKLRNPNYLSMSLPTKASL